MQAARRQGPRRPRRRPSGPSASSRPPVDASTRPSLAERQGRGRPHHRGRPGRGRRLPRRRRSGRGRGRGRRAARRPRPTRSPTAKADAIGRAPRRASPSIAVDAASAVVQKPLDPAAQMHGRSRTTSTGPARRADLATDPHSGEPHARIVATRRRGPRSQRLPGCPTTSTRSSGARSRSSSSSACSVGSSAGPAIKNGLTGRTERIAKELDDAAAAKAEAEAKLTDVQHRIADADNERQRILDEAARPRRSLKAQLAGQGRHRRRRAASRGPPPTSRPRRARPSPTSQAEPPRSPSVPPRRSSNRNLDAATQHRAHRELHQPGRSRTRS